MSILSRKVTISVSNHMTYGFKPLEIEFSDLYQVINSKTHYSMSTFLGGHRKQDNFEGRVDCIGLDIDGGWSLEKAKGFLDHFGRSSLITTTKSHQKDKEGKVEDRFRIVLLLNKTHLFTIEEFKEFTARIQKLFRNKPDPACNEPGRFFYGNPAGQYWYNDATRMWTSDDLPTIKKATYQQTGMSASDKETELRIGGIERVVVQEGTPGNRNRILFWAMKTLEDIGLSKGQVIQTVNYLNGKLSDPLQEREIKILTRDHR